VVSTAWTIPFDARLPDRATLATFGSTWRPEDRVATSDPVLSTWSGSSDD
jgi:hypothetical protein